MANSARADAAAVPNPVIVRLCRFGKYCVLDMSIPLRCHLDLGRAALSTSTEVECSCIEVGSISRASPVVVCVN